MLEIVLIEKAALICDNADFGLVDCAIKVWSDPQTGRVAASGHLVGDERVLKACAACSVVEVISPSYGRTLVAIRSAHGRYAVFDVVQPIPALRVDPLTAPSLVPSYAAVDSLDDVGS